MVAKLGRRWREREREVGRVEENTGAVVASTDERVCRIIKYKVMIQKCFSYSLVLGDAWGAS